MAVIEISELYSRSGDINQGWLRTYHRQFQVITNFAPDGPVTVRAALSGIYGIFPGQYYWNSPVFKWVTGDNPIDKALATETDPFAFVHRIQPTCTTVDGKQWLVDVDYGPYDPTLNSESPLDNRTQKAWSFAQDTEIVDVDANGNAVMNTAGDLFDPPIERDRSRPILTVARNELTFDPSLAALYKDKVNADPFLGYDPGQVKCSNISATEEWYPGIGIYYRVNYEFHFNTDDGGWQRKILNAGYRRLKSGSRRQILIDGLPAHSPVPLGNDGDVLPPSGTPVFLTFDIYPSVPFSPLNIT